MHLVQLAGDPDALRLIKLYELQLFGMNQSKPASL
jgi:hypothetical protein